MQQNSNKKRLPYWFQTGGGRNGLKYGSSCKIREIWQPYHCRQLSWQLTAVLRWLTR